jgi:hypothetical protein
MEPTKGRYFGAVKFAGASVVTRTGGRAGSVREARFGSRMSATANDGTKDLKIHRLGQVFAEPRFQAAVHVGSVCEATEGDDRQARADRPDLSAKVPPGPVSQTKIGDHQIERFAANGRQRVAAVRRHFSPMAVPVQHLGDQGGRIRVVVDNQNSHVLSSAPPHRSHEPARCVLRAIRYACERAGVRLKSSDFPEPGLDSKWLGSERGTRGLCQRCELTFGLTSNR